MDILAGAFLCCLGLALEIEKGRSIGKAPRSHTNQV
jgi:hypothetical protein